MNPTCEGSVVPTRGQRSPSIQTVTAVQQFSPQRRARALPASTLLRGIAVALALVLGTATAAAQAPGRLGGDQARTVEQVAVTRTGTGLLLGAFRLEGKGAPVVAIVRRPDDLAAVVLTGEALKFEARGHVDMPLVEGLKDDVSVRDVVWKDVDGDKSQEIAVTVEGRAPFFGKGDGETHALYVLGLGPDGAPVLRLAQELRFRGSMQAKCESHAHARATEIAGEDLLGDDHHDLRITVKESKRDCEAPSDPCTGEALKCRTVNTQAQELWIWKDGAFHRHEGD